MKIILKTQYTPIVLIDTSFYVFIIDKMSLGFDIKNSSELVALFQFPF